MVVVQIMNKKIQLERALPGFVFSAIGLVSGSTFVVHLSFASNCSIERIHPRAGVILGKWPPAKTHCDFFTHFQVI